jgi:hypothetical protein
MKDTHTLHMRLMEKRDNAVKVTAAKRAEPGRPLFYHWIPRSLIAYSRIEPSPVPGEFAFITFTLPEWKIEQANLWDFVRSAAPSTTRPLSTVR